MCRTTSSSGGGTSASAARISAPVRRWSGWGDDEQDDADRYRAADQQGDQGAVGNVVDHGVGGITWIKVTLTDLDDP
jgi:hypothetical protein